jgi:hypothetical protein
MPRYSLRLGDIVFAALALAFILNAYWGISSWRKDKDMIVTGEPAELFLPPAGEVTQMGVLLYERRNAGRPVVRIPPGHVPLVLGVMGRAQKYHYRKGYWRSLCFYGTVTLSLQDGKQVEIDFATEGSGKLVFCCEAGSFQGESVQDLLDAVTRAEQGP